MKVKIKGVVGGNNHDNETLVLDVIEDTDMEQYIVMDSTYNPDRTVSNRFRHVYWFPPKKVKEGDIVVLFTKRGEDFTDSESNKTIHFFHWNVDTCIWNNDGDCAVLLHCDDGTSKKVK